MKERDFLRSLEWQPVDEQTASETEFDRESDGKIIFYNAYYDKIDDNISMIVCKNVYDNSKDGSYILQIKDPFGNTYLPNGTDIQQFHTFIDARDLFVFLTEINHPLVYIFEDLEYKKAKLVEWQTFIRSWINHDQGTEFGTVLIEIERKINIALNINNKSKNN